MKNFFDCCAHPVRLQGCLIEAPLHGVFIGEICIIERSLLVKEVIAKAQVVGFKYNLTVLSLIGRAQGLTREMIIRPTGLPFVFPMNTQLLGKIFDASGELVDVLCNHSLDHIDSPSLLKRIDNPPINVIQRKPINNPLSTGIRAIDGLLTCGLGQRVGIFAAAGSGKTSLMSMLIKHAASDVCIIALIGERGREVIEFIDELKLSLYAEKTILIYATSDSPPIERVNAALLATAIAEYFRDLGKDVLLFVDSMTRYARALRDVALSAGELPARKGYPASVFEQLPLLLERPGQIERGSITAFYTVLLENEDESDPIGDEIRSILDGHIYLSYKLAGRGHYPAIDILRSVSRVLQKVAKRSHQQSARIIREHLSRLENIQLYIELGEYQRGENIENDKALDKQDDINLFLQQKIEEFESFDDMLDRLIVLAC